jgi:uncharacterized protein
MIDMERQVFDRFKAALRERLDVFEIVLFGSRATGDAGFLLEGNRSPQSIVNRAYYAMFYAALALLETVGKVPSKHAGVISLFDTEFVLKGELPKDLSKDFPRP